MTLDVWPVRLILVGALCQSAVADYENKLIIDLGPGPRPLRAPARKQPRDDDVLNDVKEIIMHMEHVFNERFKALSDRVSKLERVQEAMATLHDEAKIDWKPLGSNGKRIRVNSEPKTWADAKAACAKNGGRLLTVESDTENKKITDYLQNFEQSLYWIGAQATVSYSMPTGHYHNFEVRPTSTDCAALTTAGRWQHSDCQLRHGFVCQF